jgi:hypothetical protein
MKEYPPFTRAELHGTTVHLTGDGIQCDIEAHKLFSDICDGEGCYHAPHGNVVILPPASAEIDPARGEAYTDWRNGAAMSYAEYIAQHLQTVLDWGNALAWLDDAEVQKTESTNFQTEADDAYFARRRK